MGVHGECLCFGVGEWEAIVSIMYGGMRGLNCVFGGSGVLVPLVLWTEERVGWGTCWRVFEVAGLLTVFEITGVDKRLYSLIPSNSDGRPDLPDDGLYYLPSTIKKYPCEIIPEQQYFVVVAAVVEA